MMKVKILLITQVYLLIALLSGYLYEVLTLYFCLIIHELGHVITTLLLKKKIAQLEISPLGGILTIDKCQNDKNYKELLIYCSGPLSSLLLFFVLKTMGANELLINSSLYVLILNLLPILPLDGAKILMSIKQYLMPFRLVLKIVTHISIIVTLFLVFYFVNNYSYVIILLFFLYKNLLNNNNIAYDYYEFLYYKLFNPNERLKTKMHTNVKEIYSAFYKGFNNIFFMKNKFIAENEVIDYLLKEKSIDINK
ncbi:MAG: Zn-dependent protease [Haloplasmataceae bacterium]|nr:Zn-dependent protease [Haloplasmataceae bacterium]